MRPFEGWVHHLSQAASLYSEVHEVFVSLADATNDCRNLHNDCGQLMIVDIQ